MIATEKQRHSWWHHTTAADWAMQVVQWIKSAYPCSFNVFDVSLDRQHCLLVRCIDAVPDTQAASALSYHNITAWHPLDIAAVGQQCGALLLGDVVQMQVATLVSEQQMRRPGIQLLHVQSIVYSVGTVHN